MKAIEILEKALKEGWDNSTVLLTDTDDAIPYESATDFAKKYAGCNTVLLSDKTLKNGFNPLKRYALVWMNNDDIDCDDPFFRQAAFIGAAGTDCTLYFFEID